MASKKIAFGCEVEKGIGWWGRVESSDLRKPKHEAATRDLGKTAHGALLHHYVSHAQDTITLDRWNMHGSTTLSTEVLLAVARHSPLAETLSK